MREKRSVVIDDARERVRVFRRARPLPLTGDEVSERAIVDVLDRSKIS